MKITGFLIAFNLKATLFCIHKRINVIIPVEINKKYGDDNSAWTTSPKENLLVDLWKMEMYAVAENGDGNRNDESGVTDYIFAAMCLWHSY